MPPHPKRLIATLALCQLLMACGTLEVGVERMPTLESTASATRAIQATQTAQPPTLITKPASVTTSPPATMTSVPLLPTLTLAPTVAASATPIPRPTHLPRPTVTSTPERLAILSFIGDRVEVESGEDVTLT